jgi:acyl-coenzyme A synthetase/AMP-(fatty) acid ligase
MAVVDRRGDLCRRQLRSRHRHRTLALRRDRAPRRGSATRRAAHLRRGHDRRILPFEEFVAGCSTADLDQQLAGDTMLYTSGTTGRPKGVLRPMAPDMPPPSRVGRGGMMMLQAYLGGEPDRVHLVAAPLYHSGPVSYCEGASLLGADVVLMDGWDAAEFLHLIESHAVTSTFVVPIHFVRLLKLSAEERSRCDLSSLRLVVHGAAPTAIEVKRKMIEWFGPILFEFYGGTEGGGISISSDGVVAQAGQRGPALQPRGPDPHPRRRWDAVPCGYGGSGVLPPTRRGRLQGRSAKNKRRTSRRSVDPRRHRISRRGRLLFLATAAPDVIVTGA